MAEAFRFMIYIIESYINYCHLTPVILLLIIYLNKYK